MNWLDIVIAIVLLISLFTAFRNGLSGEAVRLLALVLGVVAGMWWYGRLAGYYEPYIPSRQLAEFAAFMTFLVASVIAGGVVAWGLAKLLGWTGLRWFDRLLGGVFGAVRGLLISAIVVMAVVAFPPVSRSDETVAASRLAPWVLYGAQAAAGLAPKNLRDEFSAGFERVRNAWIERVPDSVVRE
jgi:membrane protein required for colicin V production